MTTTTLTDLAAAIDDLRALWRAFFVGPDATFYSPTEQYARINGPAQSYAAERMEADIKAAIADGDAARCWAIANDFDGRLRSHVEVAYNRQSRGVCTFHPGVRVTSRDGMYDAPCGACEAAMSEQYA